MNREELFRKLHALSALAERGATPAESKAAADMLAKLMEKHDVTDAELSDDCVESRQFNYKGERERKLLLQIVTKVMPEWVGVSYYYRKNGRRLRETVGYECTKAQKAEIDLLFEFYKELYKKEEEMLYTAFINKHDIFGVGRSKNTEVTPLDELMKLQAMMRGLDEASPQKRIGDTQ